MPSTTLQWLHYILYNKRALLYTDIQAEGILAKRTDNRYKNNLLGKKQD